MILKSGDEEFLIRKDVLAILGIDIERQLEMLASPTTADGENDQEEPVITRGKVQGDKASDVHNPVEVMIRHVVDEGFLIEKVDQTIVHAHDIWRVSL